MPVCELSLYILSPVCSIGGGGVIGVLCNAETRIYREIFSLRKRVLGFLLIVCDTVESFFSHLG
jgi:hypothetical protein